MQEAPLLIELEEGSEEKKEEKENLSIGKKKAKDESTKKKKEVKPKVKSPIVTHFLALRIDNPMILENLECLSSNLIKNHCSLEKHKVRSASYHITLFVLRAEEKEEKMVQIFNANCLEEVNKLFEDGFKLEINLRGIGEFGGHRVLFAEIEKDENREKLETLISCLHEKFKQEDSSMVDSKLTLSLHVTLFKVRTKGKLGIKEENYLEHINKHFGVQPCNTIHLLKMKASCDGYYEMVSMI